MMRLVGRGGLGVAPPRAARGQSPELPAVLQQQVSKIRGETKMCDRAGLFLDARHYSEGR